MALYKRQRDFLDSEQGKGIRHILQQMEADSGYNTVSSYSANSTDYPDNLMPFVDKHLNYLLAHPKLDTTQYIANLRLKTRIR